MTDPATRDFLDDLRRALDGRYTVERLLGAGGMGSVYLGRDVTLDRPVAIKVIAPELAAAEAIRERFLHEARTVARLRHPNLVAVYAAGETDGILYFVMEYVPGESLRDLLARERRFEGARAVTALRDLARALDYAHAQGVVHRDVKPENVLLNAQGSPLLTDFGVARALAAGASDDGRMTGTGFVLGSPRYMSPEQAAGERELDGRSDVYSLGLIGYEMFVGEPAVTASSAASILIKQLTETPAPITTRNAAAALLATGAAGWYAARGRDGVPDGVDPRKSFLVTPFEILRGDPELAWLREGSVSMLTLNLAQWADLSVVDYERSLDLLRDAGLDDRRRVGLEDARALARRAGAWTVVTGQVNSTRDSLIVVASLYDVAGGRRVDQAQQSAARAADPRPLYDALARDLLDLVGAPPGTLQLARTTTSSVEAYRAYLEGVRALNSWQLARADSLFGQATRADSTFALAYYKHAPTLGWMDPGDTAQLALVARAGDHAGRLPARERGLVSAYADLVRGLTSHFAGDTARANASYLSAQRKYAAIVQRDSADAEAWYGLGDAYFHHVPDGFGPATVANHARSCAARGRDVRGARSGGLRRQRAHRSRLAALRAQLPRARPALRAARRAGEGGAGVRALSRALEGGGPRARAAAHRSARRARPRAGGSTGRRGVAVAHASAG